MAVIMIQQAGYRQAAPPAILTLSMRITPIPSAITG